MAEVWDVLVGEELTRQERRTRFGGAIYGGIEPSRTTPNVFIYSDPARGQTYGYNYDGWSSDGSLFLYTGEGRVGQQQLKDGNMAIYRHKEDPRSLRVFVANGFVGGTGTKRQVYLGEFEVDPDQRYFPAEAPDINGNLRTVLVFRLRPVGDVLRREEDKSATGEPTTVAEVQVADPASAEEVDPEAHNTPTFKTKGSQPLTAVRREAELVKRYRQRLQKQGHVVKSHLILPPGEDQYLRTDLFDATTSELCEAKGDATRESIRNAIGQVLDYRRRVPANSLAVLVPSRPSDDLVGLLHGLEMACIFEETPGKFVRLDP